MKFLPCFILTGMLLSVLPRLSLAEDASTTGTLVMSLNIYGYATMPQAAGDYARLANGRGVDVLLIQEGVQDWHLDHDLPTDYERAGELHKALGECWERSFQVFVNRCSGYSLHDHRRFDLADGPNATRTGETGVVHGPEGRFLVINLHWDHESEEAREASVAQTANAATTDLPVVAAGDFNTQCSGEQVSKLAEQAALQLAVDGGIDCLLVRGLRADGEAVSAAPSDHPAVLARIMHLP